MTYYISQRDSGQMIERAYAISGQSVIRRTTDRSTQSVRYAISRILRDDPCEYWQQAPRNKRWRSLSVAELALADGTEER